MKVLALLLVNVAHSADVGIAQRSRSLCFADQAGCDFLLVQRVATQEFQGDRAAQVLVFGLPDLSHPAFAEFLEDLVVADVLTDQDASILPVNELDSVRRLVFHIDKNLSIYVFTRRCRFQQTAPGCRLEVVGSVCLGSWRSSVSARV